MAKNGVEINIKTQVDKAVADIEAVNGKLDKLGSVTKNGGLRMTELASSLQIAQQMFGTLGRVIDGTVGKYVENANAVRVLSKATGMNAETASRWKEVADDAKISTDKLTLAMKYAISQGVDVSVEGIGRLSNQYQLLGTQQEKTRFLMENFGRRTGAELFELFEMGGEKLKAAFEGISDGLIFNEAELERAREYERKMDAINDALTEIKYNVAGDFLLPILSDAAEAMKIILTGNQQIQASLATHNEEVVKTSSSYKGYVAEMIRAQASTKNLGVSADELMRKYQAGEITIEQVQRLFNRFGMDMIVINQHQYDLMKGTLDLTNAQWAWGAALNYLKTQTGEAAGATGELENELTALNNIDLNFGNKIKDQLENMKFQEAGGAEIQEQVDNINQAFADGLITQEQYKQYMGEAYAAYQGLQVELGKTTSWDAAVALARDLEIPLDEARLAVKEAKTTLDEWPDKIRKELELDIRINQFGGVDAPRGSQPVNPGRGGVNATNYYAPVYYNGGKANSKTQDLEEYNP